ncbi:MAG TPA: hypothetical protein VGH44_06035 [Candidatus Saccharimonadia bacterium]|jgi:hypothetical protein
MRRYPLPFEFPDRKSISVREVYDTFRAKQAIPIRILGFSYTIVGQQDNGTKIFQLVPSTAGERVEAELFSLDPSTTRQKLRRGVAVGITQAGLHNPDHDTSGCAKDFWFRQLPDDTWRVEYLAACPTCATAA